jgi:hypothetical protein
LIQWIEEGRIRLDDIITHRLPLSEAPHGYRVFCALRNRMTPRFLRLAPSPPPLMTEAKVEKTPDHGQNFPIHILLRFPMFF